MRQCHSRLGAIDRTDDASTFETISAHFGNVGRSAKPLDDARQRGFGIDQELTRDDDDIIEVQPPFYFGPVTHFAPEFDFDGNEATVALDNDNVAGAGRDDRFGGYDQPAGRRSRNLQICEHPNLEPATWVIQRHAHAPSAGLRIERGVDIIDPPLPRFSGVRRE